MADTPFEAELQQRTIEALRAQLIVAIEDAALLRAERDDALAKLAGFTAEDVELIKGLWGSLEADGHPVAYEDSDAAKLAARIQSLLPPPPSSKRDDR